ncbi:unnamed protein product [Meloidogyne enterolobii]|uniref:Uncharacterized protein n=1 Tax=Meloidogyne enterolobii TaxID=390850 RepID=A0ACB0YZ18_MELEN
MIRPLSKIFFYYFSLCFGNLFLNVPFKNFIYFICYIFTNLPHVLKGVIIKYQKCVIPIPMKFF